MTQTIAIFNQSGGVGKTTLTFNLGYHLVVLKQRVLIIDMDPQASLTVFCGLYPDELEQTVYESIMDGDVELPRHRIHGIDLTPANINLAGAELELVADGMRDMRLKEAIGAIRDKYDFILIDCPPSLGVLSSISLVAADSVLVPIQTEYKSLMGTSLLLNTIGRLKKRSNRQLKIAGFVPTLYTSGTIQHERGLTGIREQLGQLAPVFDPIPRRIDFPNSVEEHKPLALYNSKHTALPTLKKIAKYLVGERVNAIA